MSVEQEVKDVLSELIAEDRKIQRNTIPRNVDSSYKIAINMNWKEMLIVFLPSITFLIIAFLVFFFLGLLNIWTGIAIFLVGAVFWISIYGLITVPAVKDKENIRVIDFLKQMQTFSRRQKVYFYQGRKETDD